MVTAGVDRDAAQPGREFRMPAKAADPLDEGAADILNDVVRVGGRPGEPPGETVNSVVVATQQGGERIAIAGDGGDEKVSIRVAAEIRHPSTRSPASTRSEE